MIQTIISHSKHTSTHISVCVEYKWLCVFVHVCWRFWSYIWITSAVWKCISKVWWEALFRRFLALIQFWLLDWLMNHLLQWNISKLILRVYLHHGPWSRTMKDGLFMWSDLMVQLSWSNFFKDQFTKSLSLSLGVNQMCTKRIDHAPRNGCADFF
jgi:hypothetical protein